jgi:hypothetical protein
MAMIGNGLQASNSFTATVAKGGCKDRRTLWLSNRRFSITGRP